MQKSTRVEKSCFICSSNFSVSNCFKDKAKYCSRKCYWISLEGHKGYWLGRKRPDMAEESSRWWKGDNIGYRGLHDWVEKQLGKAKYCSKDLTHISTRYCWANVSGQYKREVNDWRQLCTKCNLIDGIKIHPRFLDRRVSI